MIDIHGIQFEGETDFIQSVPGSHIWQESVGAVEVDGEKWHGRMFLFVSKEPLSAEGVSVGPSHEFDTYQFHRWDDEWFTTSVYFATPIGPLKIDSVGGCQ